jgi:hypothetical protein
MEQKGWRRACKCRVRGKAVFPGINMIPFAEVDDVEVVVAGRSDPPAGSRRS